MENAKWIFEYDTDRELQSRQIMRDVTDVKLAEGIVNGAEIVRLHILAGNTLHARGYTMGTYATARELWRRIVNQKDSE